MEHNAKNICRNVINGKEENFNKKWLNLKFPYFLNTSHVHFGQIQYFFDTFNNA